jgi:hypothetical protein
LTKSFYANDNFETQESTPINMFLDDFFAADEGFKFSPQVLVLKQQTNNRSSDVVPETANKQQVK